MSGIYHPGTAFSSSGRKLKCGWDTFLTCKGAWPCVCFLGGRPQQENILFLNAASPAMDFLRTLRVDVYFGFAPPDVCICARQPLGGWSCVYCRLLAAALGHVMCARLTFSRSYMELSFAQMQTLTLEKSVSTLSFCARGLLTCQHPCGLGEIFLPSCTLSKIVARAPRITVNLSHFHLFFNAITGQGTGCKI